MAGFNTKQMSRRLVLSFALGRARFFLPLMLVATCSGCLSCRDRISDKYLQIPKEYLRFGYRQDNDVIITLDGKGMPDRANPVFVFWYKGAKILNVMDGESYVDIGDYFFVLTVEHDCRGHEFLTYSQDGHLRRRIRAHLLHKKSLKVYSTEPIDSEYTCINKGDNVKDADVVSLHGNLVNVYSQYRQKNFKFEFKFPRR